MSPPRSTSSRTKGSVGLTWRCSGRLKKTAFAMDSVRDSSVKDTTTGRRALVDRRLLRLAHDHRDRRTIHTDASSPLVSMVLRPRRHVSLHRRVLGHLVAQVDRT